jgi:hypothetical protein
MNERIGASFQLQVVATMACGLLVIVGALLLVARGRLIDGLLLAGAATLLLRWYWRATARKRALGRRGFHAGRRVGSHWAYEEWSDIPGVGWLDLLARHFRRTAWLNPEPERFWRVTAATLAQIFPMYRLTLYGLPEAVHPPTPLA